MTELSKREEFAKAAMQAIITGGCPVDRDEDIEETVKLARKIADAQLKELRDNQQTYQPPRCYDSGPG